MRIKKDIGKIALYFVLGISFSALWGEDILPFQEWVSKEVKTPSHPLLEVFAQVTEPSAPPQTAPAPLPVVEEPLPPFIITEKTIAKEDIPVCPDDPKDQGYIINLKDVDFVQYLHFLSKLTNTNFIFNEEDINFKVTVMAEEPTSLKDIRSALLQILRINGLSLLEQGNNVVIHKSTEVASLGAVVSEDLGNLCNATEAIITRVFTLKSLNPEKAAVILKPLISTGAYIEVSNDTHHLIVTDVSTSIQKIGDLLKSLDNPNAAFEVGLYQAKKTFVGNLVPMAEKILFPLAEGVPLVLVPQEVSDTVFIVSSPFLVERAIEVMKTLDLGYAGSTPAYPKGHEENVKFLLYKLQYHKGDQIQTTLQEIGSSLAHAGAANLDLINSINSAQWIEATNSLLFVGEAKSLEKIKELLGALDAPLKQVLIEVLAIRTSITNALQLGVQYGTRLRDESKVVGAGSLLTNANPSVSGNVQLPNLFQSLDQITTKFIPLPKLENALGLNVGAIGNIISSKSGMFADLAALVTALQTDQDTEVILNPKIVTQDTVPATVYIGTTRPYQTSSILQASGGQQGNFVTASLEYRELGTTLTVTPYLGSSDMITLEVDQTTNDYVTNATQGSNSSNFTLVPITSNSRTTTRVHVPNKHFLMISGMMEDTTMRTKSAFPCLGGIPLIGDALGTKNNIIDKDNLIIFIRPHIVDTVEDMEEVTKREDQFYREKSKSGSFIYNSYKLWSLN